MLSKQFGGKITSELIARYEQSPNWSEGKFANFEETSVGIDLYKAPGIIYQFLTQKANREPDQPIPLPRFDPKAFLQPASEPKFIWYGHSVVLLRMEGLTLLIDPMLGPDASPIAPMSTSRFSENTLGLIDEFPEIDLLLMTHDHYDHLDYASIQKLKGKTRKYFVALGVKRHLESWGIDPDIIEEFDWWDQRSLDNISITFTPTRHFSGRGLTDRAKSLWGGWVFQGSEHAVWFSGDGGYGNHFRRIGEKFEGFDFAFMECGQYNENWIQIHMLPEESIRAAMDAGVKKSMPVHWAGFSLAPHPWTEPAERFVKAANSLNQTITLPQQGYLHAISDSLSEAWWKT